ncbi:MAG: hypothetical protein Q3979_07935 [Actinomycetaceae bacterium]|nr:hypothetical protein [Actinomycetaceae bacterium]
MNIKRKKKGRTARLGGRRARPRDVGPGFAVASGGALPPVALSAVSDAVRAEVGRVAELAGMEVATSEPQQVAEARAAVLNLAEVRASVPRVVARFHPSYAPYFTAGPAELTLPDEAEDLLEFLLAAGSTLRGTVVAVVGTHGGSGATTLAAWLAREWSATVPTALIDADPCSAGIDVLLGLDGDAGIRWPDIHAESGALVPGRLKASLPAYGNLVTLSADREGALGSAALGRNAVAALSQAADVCVVDFSAEAMMQGNVAASMLAWADIVVLVAGAGDRGVRGVARAMGTLPAGVESIVAAVGVGGGAQAASMAMELGVDRVYPVRWLRNLQADVEHGMRVGDRSRSGTARDIAAIARACEELA